MKIGNFIRSNDFECFLIEHNLKNIWQEISRTYFENKYQNETHSINTFDYEEVLFTFLKSIFQTLKNFEFDETIVKLILDFSEWHVDPANTNYSTLNLTGVFESLKLFNVSDQLFNKIKRNIKKQKEEIKLILNDFEKTPNKNITNSNLKIPRSNLHPKIKNVAEDLFKGAHYRQAILDTYIALVEEVKIKSMLNFENSKLMQQALSQKNPILKLSKDEDEQLGYMWLFSGAVKAIRNPKAHRLFKFDDAQKAIEWLYFASALFKVLENSEFLEENLPKQQ